MSASINKPLVAVAVIAVGAFALARGPLTPPAGPIAQTNPDLGQILSAVNALGASGSCANLSTNPGELDSATITFDGIGTSPILEYEIGASSSFMFGGGPGGSAANAKTISVTRLADSLSPHLLIATTSVLHIPKATISLAGLSGQDNESYEMTDVVLTSICNVMVTTCEGPTCAERLTFEVRTLEYSNSGVTLGWDFATATPL